MKQTIDNVELSQETRIQLGQREDHMLPPEWLIERELGRYYALLDRGRVEARELLSTAEKALIIDALNGTGFLTDDIRSLPYEIADAVELDGLDHRWGVDGQSLVETLSSMSMAALTAVVDAVERYWLGHYAAGEWSKLLD